MKNEKEDIINIFDRFKKENKIYMDICIQNIEFERKQLDEVATFPTITRFSGNIDKTVDEYAELSDIEKENYIGWITATTENNQINGYILKTKVSDKQISNKHVISWTRINLSKFYIQDNPVCTNDDSFVMEARDGIYYKYIAYSASAAAMKLNYNWSRKAGKSVVKDLEVFIPKAYNLYSSFQIQRVIIEFIQYVKNTSKKINELSCQLLEKSSLWKEEFVKQLFEKNKDIEEYFCKWNIKYNDFNINDVEFEQCKLEDIASKIRAGGTPKTTNKNYWNNDLTKIEYVKFFPWLDINKDDFQKGYIDTFRKSVTKEGLDNSSTWLVPKNSVLITIVGSNLGLVAINKIPLTTNQNILSVVFDDRNDSRYLMYYLRSKYKTWLGNVSGYSSISKTSESKRIILIPKPFKGYSTLQIENIIVEFIEYYLKRFEKIMGISKNIKEKQEIYWNEFIRNLFW